MGWSLGFDDNWNRDIGYGVPAVCDMPGCEEHIDRGLSYVCGQEPYGGEYGCGLYFCGAHLFWKEMAQNFVCRRCRYGRRPYPPKPDVPEWIQHKLHDASWAGWRAENPEWVKSHSTQEDKVCHE